MDDQSLKLTDAEIRQAFAEPAWAEKYPPVLDIDQAAELARIPKATIYSWSSAGRLRGCSRRVGKHLRIFRDRFIKRIFNEGLNNAE